MIVSLPPRGSLNTGAAATTSVALVDTDRHYRPKKGETVVAVFPCSMAQMVTETKATAMGDCLPR